MKKILIIDNSHYPTGAFKSITGLTEMLHHDFEFHFLIPRHSSVATILKEKKYPVKEMDFLEISKSMKALKYKSTLKKNAEIIDQYMQAKDIKVLHVNDLYNQTGTFLKQNFKNIHLIQHVRLLKNSYLKLLYPYFIGRLKAYANEIICVSEIAKKDMGDSDNAHIIYGCLVEEEKMPPFTIKNELPARLLSPGRLMKGKGQDYVIEACSLLKKKKANFKLTFAGANSKETKYERQLKRRIKAKKLTNFIEIIPFQKDIEALMKSHDILVNFSESESFSMVCLEGLFYGIPTISSDCGGPSEIIEDGKTGILVENKNSYALAKAITSLIENPKLRSEFSVRGKREVRRRFNPEKSARQMEDLYNKYFDNHN